MNFAPYILQSAKSFKLSTTRSVDQCIEALQAIVSSGTVADKKKTLVGTVNKDGFTLIRKPGFGGAFFAPTITGQYEPKDGGTDIVCKTAINKLGKALLNAAINTILGAVIGVVVCLFLMPDAVAVTYSFLCMVLIPALILIFATAVGYFVMSNDTSSVLDLLAKELGATQTEVPAKQPAVMPTLMQEWYAAPATVILFTLCAYCLHSIFWNFWAQGDYIQTTAMCRPVCIFTSALLGDKSFVTADCRYYLAESLRCSIRLREAAQMYDENIQAFKNAQGPMAKFLADNMYGLARIEDLDGHHQEAEEHYRKAVELWSAAKDIGPNSSWVAKGLDRLSMLCLKENKFEQATTAMKRALEIDRSLGDKSSRSVGEDLNDLALIYDKEENFKEADATYKAALEAKERTVGNDHYSVGTTLNNLADIEKLLGHQAESKRLKERADRIWLAWLGIDFRRYTDDMQRYRQLTKIANSDYERPNADTRFDGLRPYLGRY